MVLTVALAACSGCGGEPSIAVTTTLPIDYPPEVTHRILRSMCQPALKFDNQHVKVHWLRHGPRGGTLFTRTYFCSEVVKDDFKALLSEPTAAALSPVRVPFLDESGVGQTAGWEDGGKMKRGDAIPGSTGNGL